MQLGGLVAVEVEGVMGDTAAGAYLGVLVAMRRLGGRRMGEGAIMERKERRKARKK
jgi:hypothetical protein